MSSYSKWYRDGNMSPTNGSKSVVGSNTYWKTAGLNPGDIVKIGGVDYELEAVTDNTHLTLATPYQGATASGVAYAIVRNFTATSSANVAAVAAKLLGDVEYVLDKDLQKINGKSAYEVAKDSGFTGTQAQWLESLKAAGEWSNAQSRLTALDARTNPFTLGTNHKFIYRGKNLGSVVTDAQWQAIRSGSFDDLYLGDYWMINGKQYIIVDFDYYYGLNLNDISRVHHIVIMIRQSPAPYKADGDVSEGYYGSDLRQTFIPAFTTDYIIPAFGEAHLYKHQDYICNAFDATTGKATGHITVQDSCVEIPSWKMVMPFANINSWWNALRSFTQPVERSHEVMCHRIFSYFYFNHNAHPFSWFWCREIPAIYDGTQYGLFAANYRLLSVTPISDNQNVMMYFTVC